MSYAHRRALAAAFATAFTTVAAVAADEETSPAPAAQAAAQPEAQAAAQPPAQAAAQPAASKESLPTAKPTNSLLAMKPVDAKTLAGRRGGADVLNDMKLKGVVSDNKAVNVTTGNNVISEGAFAGTTGLPMVVQNTGNNVLIQNATIVNVQVK
jgi:hypothetical protein